MKRYFFILLLLTSFFSEIIRSKAQHYSIEISSEVKDDRSVDILFKKRDFGSFFLDLHFNRMENSAPAHYKGTLVSTQGKLLNIRPVNPDRAVDFSCSYTYVRGQFNPKIDTAFVYLLPGSKGKNLKVTNLLNFNATYLGSVKPKNWKSFEFDVSPGDTVFSSRKGLVVEVKDDVEPDPTLSVSFSSESNFVLVEHDDGTLARYLVLKKGSLMVRPGQLVYPHTPLALAGTYDVGRNSQIRFYVYYLIEENLDESKDARKTNYYAFLNPLFYTSEGVTRLDDGKSYTAAFQTEHLQKELTKREKKKLDSSR